jgi:hypothetical protein
MVKQLTDEDYDWLSGRLSGSGDPGMQSLSEEGRAALVAGPPDPSQTELAEAGVEALSQITEQPPETGPIPEWAKEWGYLPQKAWDTTYYDIPIARLMDFPFEKGGRVHTVHEGDYVENLGNISTIRMDPNGFNVSVEVVPDDGSAPFWIGGEPGDAGAIVDRLRDVDIDLINEIAAAMKRSQNEAIGEVGRLGALEPMKQILESLESMEMPLPAAADPSYVF